MLIQSHYGYFVCIPYRSEIKHKNAFLFKNTKRSKHHKSGLDYSKMVIVSDLEYIDDKTTKIDQDEYNATRDNIVKIKDAAVKYIDEYVNFLKDGTGISRQEFKRKYEYSTLKYFHNELGLKSE